MLGAVADDFTGATDLAMALVARGFRTVVTIGVPRRLSLEGQPADAVVVALKTRTIDPSAAVAASRNAMRGLRQMGATRIYDKYCSTFDSTPHGNIGPILDALAADLGTDLTVVVPSFPAAGRTVVDGQLYVHGTPLAESPMRHHPLTPMTDSDVPRLLAAQSQAAVSLIPLATVREGADALAQALAAVPSGGLRAVVVDAETEDDLRVIASATSDLPLITGGSGLALGLQGPGTPPAHLPLRPGFQAVLAGSASSATRGQIAHARSYLPHRKLDLAALRADFEGSLAELTAWAVSCWREQADRPVLVYAVGDLADLEPARPAGGGTGNSAEGVAGFGSGPTSPATPGAGLPPGGADQVPASELVEQALAGLAAALVDAGCRQLIVAGGETSGAVVSALNVRELVIGQPVAPGVTWATGDSRGRVLNLLLKSGNFGAEDLMTAAWAELA